MKNIVTQICTGFNMTQKELARELWVSEGTVNRWSANPAKVPTYAKRLLYLFMENVELTDQRSLSYILGEGRYNELLRQCELRDISHLKILRFMVDELLNTHGVFE